MGILRTALPFTLPSKIYSPIKVRDNFCISVNIDVLLLYYYLLFPPIISLIIPL